MPTLHIEHGARDFESWKRAFDGDPVGRRDGGVRRYRIAQASDDPNYVLVDLDFGTLVEAQELLGKLGALWSGAGERLGQDTLRGRIVERVEDVVY